MSCEFRALGICRNWGFFVRVYFTSLSCQIRFDTFNLMLEMLELHGIEADCKDFCVKNFSASLLDVIM